MATQAFAQQHMNRSRALENLAFRLYELANTTARPSHNSTESERRIEEAESIASDLRAEFRGKKWMR